jgi:hypothetical protein
MKHVLAIVMGVIGFVSLLFLGGEPTPECTHPYLTKLIAFAVFAIDIKLILKVFEKELKDSEIEEEA